MQLGRHTDSLDVRGEIWTPNRFEGVINLFEATITKLLSPKQVRVVPNNNLFKITMMNFLSSREQGLQMSNQTSTENTNYKKLNPNTRLSWGVTVRA